MRVLVPPTAWHDSGSNGARHSYNPGSLTKMRSLCWHTPHAHQQRTDGGLGICNRRSASRVRAYRYIGGSRRHTADRGQDGVAHGISSGLLDEIRYQSYMAAAGVGERAWWFLVSGGPARLKRPCSRRNLCSGAVSGTGGISAMTLRYGDDPTLDPRRDPGKAVSWRYAGREGDCAAPTIQPSSFRYGRDNPSPMRAWVEVGN